MNTYNEVSEYPVVLTNHAMLFYRVDAELMSVLVKCRAQTDLKYDVKNVTSACQVHCGWTFLQTFFNKCIFFN